MRVKLSGPDDLVAALERVCPALPDASVEGPPRRREGTELKFGVSEWADLVGSVKDLADLAPWIWMAVQAMRSGKGATERAPTAKRTIEITTATAKTRIEFEDDATLEQVAEQLAAPLRPGDRR